MIDPNLYRYRIGVYNAGAGKSSGSRTQNVSTAGNCRADNDFLSIAYLLFYLIIYLYFALCILGVTISMLRDCKFLPFSINRFHNISNSEFIGLYLTHTKLLSAILIYFVLKKALLPILHTSWFLLWTS